MTSSTKITTIHRSLQSTHMWWVMGLGFLLLSRHAMATMDCSNPQGPEAVLECFAKSQTPPTSAEALWNNKFFDPRSVDHYCNTAEMPPNPPANAVITSLYKTSCSHEKGSYFSFAKFISADRKLKDRLGDAYQFMREGTTEVKLQELANFLATAAQETTGNGYYPDIKVYSRDGLFYRYEVGYTLENCMNSPANPNVVAGSLTPGTNCDTADLDTFKTRYYPVSVFVVALKSGTSLVNTRFVMDNDCEYMLDSPLITASYWNEATQSTKRPTIFSDGAYPPPSGYTWQFMNQTLPPAYWIGMGNLQLTGVSITQFFGWYHQNIMSPKVNEADFKAFVQNYLKDGELAWMGGLWYWNFRISVGMPTVHAIQAGSKKAACHDIGIATALVNGATQCNDNRGRVAYYNYFKSTVFGLSEDPILEQGQDVNSYTCNQAILDYCTK